MCQTYYENALIKANFYFDFFKMPVICDDSGIEFSALDGFPGVDTAPFFYDNQLNFFEKLDIEINERDPLKKKRVVTFRCVLIYKDNQRLITSNGRINGTYTSALGIKPDPHYGYGPIFKLKNDKTLADLDQQGRAETSPRNQACKRLFQKIA